jgi:hypothetical protein
MNSLRQIEDFLSCSVVAISGVSRNPKKFGYVAFKELREKGMNTIPVNPSADEIMGVKAYHDISSLPDEVTGLIVLTARNNTASIIREAKLKGIKNIWIQQYSETKEALKELEGTDINYITGECILMYYKPHGIHKFHRAMKKLFGRYPK